MVVPSDLAMLAARRVGAMVCGKYRLERLVGVGGMAAVYAGRHRLGHRVALKFLHDRFSRDVKALARFHREAYAANRVDHPGALPVLDDGIDEEGAAFLVMPLLQGETVHARWERFGKSLPLAEAVAICSRALEVLRAANEKGIVHRDVKPENLFVTTEGQLRVLDFGIAHLVDTARESTTTRTGQAIGTPAFMSPEQALGRSHEVGATTDIWALGATLFTLLAGRFVHVAETAGEAVVFSATRPAPSLREVSPTVPGAIAAVVDRALAFDRSQRWSSAREMNEALSAASLEVIGERASRLPLPISEAPLWEESAAVSPYDLHDAATLDPGGRAEAPMKNVGSDTSPATLSRDTTSRSRWSRWVAVAAAGAVVATGAIGYSRTKRVSPSEASTSQVNVEAQNHLEASRRAWLDGSSVRARDEARQALAREPSSAKAQLALVVAAPFWPTSETRASYVRAQEERDRLDPVERDYVEAIAPAMTSPANFRAAADRLEKLRAAVPHDPILLIALVDMWTRCDLLDKAREALAGPAREPNAPGIVLARYAGLLELLDDVDGSRSMFMRCVDGYPGASVCSEQLADMELNEGRCADAEKVLRREVSVLPSADAYLALAYSLYGQGRRAEEIRPVLDRWAELSPGRAREWNHIRASIRLAMAGGQLRVALEQTRKLGESIHESDDDVEQFDYTQYRMLLEAELGDNTAASATLASYETERSRFQQDVFGGDNVTYLLALGAEFGFVRWSEWVAKRDARLASDVNRDPLPNWRPRQWLDVFAMPATTEAAAAEATIRWPSGHTLVDRGNRWFYQDAAVGRVLALTGDLAAAIPHYERAAASCRALEDLVQYARGLADFGDILVRRGDTPRACLTYKKVLSLWGPGSGSVTAIRVSQRYAAICRD